MPRAVPLPEAPQARGAHLGCCVWLWGSLLWGSEEELERLCRADRMGFGAPVEKLRDRGCWSF